MNVLLLQLPVPGNTPSNVPLAAGYLKAYAEARGLPEGLRIEILPRALADHAGDALLVQELVARRPDLIGVSLYTWNSERSLDILARVRAQLPGVLTVGGGPEVQRDNAWLLEHPALDIGVLGEGEQTFWELLQKGTTQLDAIPGLIFRRRGELVDTGERPALQSLAEAIPSPYLAGHLEAEAGGMLMVEVSRWCPYACSFCLYGRNMGPKLGGRYFGLERVLAEIRWGKQRGVRDIHFVEANLNLVPLFWPLMRALADLNADRSLRFYAELRGEHLTDEVVAALDRANVRVVEVGLQTANPEALRASLRRTDLKKWAAGTRRLYAHDIEVYLDVILGLPGDDADGVQQTLDFIRREELGPYDIFTLQVLPGTAVRRQAAEFGLVFQQQPPYYVLATDRLDYDALRGLRRSLKAAAGLDPAAVEGVPLPGPLVMSTHIPSTRREGPVVTALAGAPAEIAPEALGVHVGLFAAWDELAGLTPWLAEAIRQNPSTIFDLYLDAENPPEPEALAAWRAALPYRPGYLDRVAVYGRARPEPQHLRVSPRVFLLLPWSAQAEPARYAGVAEIIWRYDLAPGELPPLGAWRGAGGAGVCVRFDPECAAQYRSEVREAVRRWEQETGRRAWFCDDG
jgi:radical SAM superfamily enzyme YgiQ (UPF0313 family)